MKIEYTASMAEPPVIIPNPNLFTYTAKVVHVVDGDTLDVMVDLGFHIFVIKRLRLARINCPEKNTINGLKAKEEVEGLLLPGTTVTFKSTKLDKYGRSIAEIWYKDNKKDEINLSDYLIRSTFAVLQSY